MTAEDRRAAIIAATIPLLRARGWSVTVKEVSAAAHVAEGTIFSVFQDKEELLLATLRTALDPAPVEEQLGRIDLSLPLEERLIQAVEILQGLAVRAAELLSVVHLDIARGRFPQRFSGDHFARKVLPRLFEPSRGELRLEPVAVSQALLALTVGGHSSVIFKKPMLASEIVDVILNGILVSGVPRTPLPRTNDQ
jgi:AcrR family transcriptional regulator